MCALVAVMMVVFFAFDYRDYAPMCRFANSVFELDRRVVDTEIPQQAFLYIAQDALAD